MLFNKIATLEQFEKAQNYDFLKKKEADLLKAEQEGTLADFDRYYSVTTRWADPLKTKDGSYIWPVCAESDGVYETIEYSSDLLPAPTEDL